MKKLLPGLVLVLLLQTAFAQKPYIVRYQGTNGKYGYKNEKGEIVVEPRFDYAQVYTTDGLALVNTGGTKVSFGYEGGFWTYIDSTGKEAIRLGNEFYKATAFKNGKAFLIKDKENTISCYIDTKGRVITETGKQAYNNGNYYGELTSDLSPGGNTVKNGLRHGKGAISWNIGDKYEGDWKFGQRHGYGKYTFANGKVEEGNFVNNIFQGSSNKAIAVNSGNKNTVPADNKYLSITGAVTVTYPNGIYQGQVVNGLPNGSGKFSSANGAGYEGKWRNGEPIAGKYMFTGGAVYEGQLKVGQPDGSGKMTLKNGTVYNGVFDNGVFLNSYSRRMHRIGDLKQYSTILFEGRLFYIKGRATNNKGVSEVVLSWNNITVSPDVQVQLIREDNKGFRIYGGFVETKEAGSTVENKSTYGYYDSKKSANVVVNTTTKTYVPDKIKKVPREGYDQFGYKWVEVLPASDVEAQVFTERLPLPPIGETYTGLGGNARNITPAPIASQNGLLFIMVFQGKEQLWEYKGEIKNGKADGVGEAVTDLGLHYQGKWKDGLFHGTGELSVANSFWYKGEFKEGLRDGKGYQRSEGTTYDGEWKDDLYHGRGKLHGSQEYDGVWANGKRNGKGYGTVPIWVPIKGSTMSHSANGYYLGEWKDDKMHGNGKLVRRERDTEKEHGKTYIVEEGLFEEGSFKSGDSKKAAEQKVAALRDEMRRLCTSL